MNKRAKVILTGVGIAGLVVYFYISVMAVAAVLGWRAAQRAGNEAATIQNIKTIVAVETQYSANHDQRFGTFEQLVADSLLSRKFGGGNPVVTDGYILTLTLRELPSSYVLTADPHDRNDPSNHFYVDSVSGQIHVNPEKPASPADPLFEDSRRLRSIAP